MAPLQQERPTAGTQGHAKAKGVVGQEIQATTINTVHSSKRPGIVFGRYPSWIFWVNGPHEMPLNLARSHLLDSSGKYMYYHRTFLS